MTTISSIISLYDSVLNGKTCLLHDYLISSNGLEWLVNSIPIDTIENRKKILDAIISNAELAKELLNFIGDDTSKMFDEYYLIHDSNMFFLVKKDKDFLVLIHIVESIVDKSTMVEKIDIKKGTMKCYYFNQMFNELKSKNFYLEGPLSIKSKNLIDFKLKEKELSVTQNFFYDMLFDGMTNYHDLIQSIISCPIKTFDETDDNKIVLRVSLK